MSDTLKKGKTMGKLRHIILALALAAVGGSCSDWLYLEPEDGYRDRCDLEGWISAAAARRLFWAC